MYHIRLARPDDLGGLPADQRVAMRRELQPEINTMPIPEAQERPIAEIENQLGLPTGFLRSLYDHEDDWSFVIKSHAFLEAALTHLLAEHLGKEDLLPVFAYLEQIPVWFTTLSCPA